ncbi:hypothetical protein Csa_016889 [Cucumis sativus]|uniref:Uncharacterized protein n=1 Tax=Cucumis sativus TaxID=3659 RepID=A0A0A0K9U8_CUCSA|nr:hypothetical protein Csa_016889 [Cucumis sativus]
MGWRMIGSWRRLYAPAFQGVARACGNLPWSCHGCIPLSHSSPLRTLTLSHSLYVVLGLLSRMASCRAHAWPHRCVLGLSLRSSCLKATCVRLTSQNVQCLDA